MVFIYNDNATNANHNLKLFLAWAFKSDSCVAFVKLLLYFLQL